MTAFQEICEWDQLQGTELVRELRALKVDVVRYTPHDWEDRQPYENRETGWTTDDFTSFE
jgi:hypothetical protein